MLEKIFGSEAYDVYKGLELDEQTQGINTTKMYGGELHEDWDNRNIGKRNVKLLKELYPDIYVKVVNNIMNTVYGYFPIETINKIIRYCDNPNIFEEILKQNVG